jgi:putative spermidine/putrescine transport system permease protein
MLLLAALVLLPVAIGYLVYFGAPLGLLGLQSVQPHHPVGGGHAGYLGRPLGYGHVLQSRMYRRLLGETFKLAGLCVAICLLLGYPLAWALRMASDRLKGVVVLGVLAPALVNLVVRGLGWAVVLGEFGLVNLVLRTLRLESEMSRRGWMLSELAVLGSMVEVFLPFMVLALYGAVARIDPALLRAARNLGATRLRAFVEVVVPMSLPGAAAGVAMVFALATGAYVSVAAFGAGRVHTVAEAAYAESATLVDWQLGAAVVVVVLAAAAILVRLLLAGVRRGDAATGRPASTIPPDPASPAPPATAR